MNVLLMMTVVSVEIKKNKKLATQQEAPTNQPLKKKKHYPNKK